jgi:hypothetical protein
MAVRFSLFSALATPAAYSSGQSPRVSRYI